eukprot:m.6604 g.6604  ORF g.6604 m.6604 type:complete len:691 (+) comp2691_c0_seq1:275-2347(+)
MCHLNSTTTDTMSSEQPELVVSVSADASLEAQVATATRTDVSGDASLNATVADGNTSPCSPTTARRLAAAASSRRRTVSGTSLAECGDSLPPEPQEGNTEYKLKLIDPTAYRFEHLVTQMKWRIAEGQGEALYEIGVADDGSLTGLSQSELELSLQTLREMAARVGAHATVLRTRSTAQGKCVAEVHIRRVPDSQQFLEVRVGVIGNGTAGKSTVLGVLTGGELDNGRGKARLNLFRHHHEIKTGRTSSLSHEILGFDSDGNVVNVNAEDGTAVCTAEICERSSKIIKFIDLPGHERYLRTTVFGLTGREIHYVALVVAGNIGPTGTTREHLDLAVVLQVPVFIVVTKIDLCSRSVLKKSLSEIMNLLKAPGVNKVPLVVSGKDDVVVGAGHFKQADISQVTPIFLASNVTGKNLDLLRSFLNLLPATPEPETLDEPPLFQVEETFQVHNVGPVVAGTLLKGMVRCGDTMMLGPDASGTYLPVEVIGIHRNRTPYRAVKGGQMASFLLHGVERSDIRTGQVLLHETGDPLACLEFEADIFLLHHATCLTPRFQATAYVGSVRQTVQVVSITFSEGTGVAPGASEALSAADESTTPRLASSTSVVADPSLSGPCAGDTCSPSSAARKAGGMVTGDNAIVRFRLTQRPEFVQVGARILFRDGPSKCKGIGTVTMVQRHESGSLVLSQSPRAR